MLPVRRSLIFRAQRMTGIFDHGEPMDGSAKGEDRIEGPAGCPA